MPASESSTVEPPVPETPAHPETLICPGCGQHVDKSNLRCPRCGQWFVTPPPPRSWSRLAIIVAMASLAIGGFVAGLVMQRVWQPLPPGVVVPDEPAPASDAKY